VFVGEDPEPKSLVEVGHGLAQLCAGHVYQSLRLYVVCDDDDLVEQLRNSVRDWDKS
jgi:16S rRNA A1518/A1519 N6-dimethyltransferase RsmA/KsgA/DIM1 with predicted DNA glycosylase/AP lyase activity